MKRVLFLLAYLSSVFAFAASEINTPDQLSFCLENYIRLRIARPEGVRWEHSPYFEFAGKYVHASWHTSTLLNYGSMFAFVGPKNDVYCDYPVDSNGLPQWEKGFCKANITTGEISIEHTKLDEAGNQSKETRRIGFIQNFKLYCFL